MNLVSDHADRDFSDTQILKVGAWLGQSVFVVLETKSPSAGISIEFTT